MQKIMFDDHFGLTQAVLDGRKTMTRRIVNIPNEWHGIDVCYYGIDSSTKKSILLYDADEGMIEDKNGLCGQIMPHYKVGEIVAVAQSYKDIYHLLPEDLGPLRVSNGYLHESPGATNKMFVLAHVIPHQIRITGVRVERLKDISDEDCIREGIREKSKFPHKKSFPFYFDGGKHSWDNSFRTPRQAFSTLIDKISGNGTWASNPYVFVYEFELVK